MKFLIVNGEVVELAETHLLQIQTDFSFRLSQKTWYGFGGIPLLRENLDQIKNQVLILKLSFPKDLENYRETFRLIKRMLNKNKFYRSGQIHIQILWNKNEVQTLISCNSFSMFDFPFSEDGLLTTFSKQRKNSGNTVNLYPFFNQMIWEISLAEIRHTLFQQVIVLNEKNEVCESAFANIFLIKGNKLFSPPPKTGSYSDILKPYVLETASGFGLKIYHEPIIEQSLPEMDEIFIVSELTGFQWILGINNKRFINQNSEGIYKKLNEFLKQKTVT